MRLPCIWTGWFLLVPLLICSEGCCPKRTVAYVDQHRAEALLRFVSADREKFDISNFRGFQETLMSVRALDENLQRALRIYLEVPGKSSRVLALIERVSSVEVEARRANGESGILFADLYHRRSGAADLLAIKNEACFYRRPATFLEDLFQRFDPMNMVSSRDVKSRPLIIDGSCYYFEVVASGKVHRFSFCNPQQELSDYDRRVIGILKLTKSLF